MAERTHDVGRAFAVVRKSILSIGAFASALCGCQSGAYKIATSADENTERSEIPYYKVGEGNSFVTGPMNEMVFMGDGDTVYDEDKMPILVVESEAEYSPDKPGWSGVLWLFSLGVFPMFSSEYMTQDVTVKTPIGEKTGSFRVDARWWGGWLPIFIGYPCLADERVAKAELPNSRVEEIGRNRLVEGLVKEFEFKDYVAFAKKQNASRKIELARIATSKTKIEEFVKQKKFAEAESLLAAESKSREGSLASDSETWDALKTLIADQKEDCRVADKKSDLEKKFAEGKFEDVVSGCDAERRGDPRHAEIWRGLKAKAKGEIVKRDRERKEKEEAAAALKRARDREVAKKSFEEDMEKAKQNDAEAMFRVGEIYRLGNEAVPKDLKLARKYLRKAYENGCEKAWSALEKLCE